MTGKEIFKLSCCAAIGWCVGREIYKVIDAVIDTVGSTTFKVLAEKDNQFAKTVCDKANIEYQKEEEQTCENKIIGFHM